MSIVKSELNKLDKMIGSKFMYHTRPYKIHGYVSVNGHIEIRTNKQPIKIDKEDLSDELNDFLPIEGDFGSKEIREDAQKLRNLENKLYENIDKIQDDEEYIKKAKAMTSTADTIINMEKLKIQMLKQIRD